jgi:hypothetical protein
VLSVGWLALNIYFGFILTAIAAFLIATSAGATAYRERQRRIRERAARRLAAHRRLPG